MPKLSLTFLNREQTKSIMDQPTLVKPRLLHGNISKQGELIFTEAMLRRMSISRDHFALTAMIGQDYYLVFVEQDIPDKATPFEPYRKAYKLNIAGVVQRTIPDYMQEPYNFWIEVTKGMDDPNTDELGRDAYKLWFQKGKTKH